MAVSLVCVVLGVLPGATAPVTALSLLTCWSVHPRSGRDLSQSHCDRGLKGDPREVAAGQAG